MDTIVYETAAPLKDGERFMAFLVQQVSERDSKGRKTGQAISIMLPVRFMAGSAEDARNKAIAFWNDETAKKRAQEERGRALGKRRAA